MNLMSYSDMLRLGIFNSKMSLNEIAIKLHEYGFKTSKAHISKLQNGKVAPGSDKMNEALAKVLEMDPLEFKAAAYQEKIPTEVLNKLKEIS